MINWTSPSYSSWKNTSKTCAFNFEDCVCKYKHLLAKTIGRFSLLTDFSSKPSQSALIHVYFRGWKIIFGFFSPANLSLAKEYNNWRAARAATRRSTGRYSWSFQFGAENEGERRQKGEKRTRDVLKDVKDQKEEDGDMCKPKEGRMVSATSKWETSESASIAHTHTHTHTWHPHYQRLRTYDRGVADLKVEIGSATLGCWEAQSFKATCYDKCVKSHGERRGVEIRRVDETLIEYANPLSLSLSALAALLFQQRTGLWRFTVLHIVYLSNIHRAFSRLLSPRKKNEISLHV